MPIVELSPLPKNEILPGIVGQFIHTDQLTTGYFNIKKDSILPEHSHDQEQLTHVLEGKLEMTIEGVTDIVDPGKVAVIPANAKHSAKALTDCKALDVFCPCREDYKALS